MSRVRDFFTRGLFWMAMRRVPDAVRVGGAIALVVATLGAGLAVAADARAPSRAVVVASFLDGLAKTRVLATGSGKYRTFEDLSRAAVFTFSRDTPESVKCVGRCSRAWVPVITIGSPRIKAGSRVRGRMLGTIRRPDGRLQVTYNHEPLYRAPRNQNVCADTFSAFGGTFAWIDVAGGQPTDVCGPY